MRLRALGVVLACVATLLAGCTGGGPAQQSGILTIFAPPSMTDAIEGMAQAYSGTYPGVSFKTVFEPDSALVARVLGGETPDLLFGEDPATLVAAGATGAPLHFARGQIVLAVPASDPARVIELADLARPGIRVALCEVAEPCGTVTTEVLAAAGVTLPSGALQEPDVRSALHHVTDGTADVALVYRSDVTTAGDAVHTIEVAESSAALADFVAIVPDRAPNRDVAKAFLEYLGSAPVLDALTRDGFRPPT
jgi:molybdate transport system substrate-binding protein